MKYTDIVFIQNAEGDPELGPVTEYGPPTVVDVLFNTEGVVVHGATEESILTAFNYLLQWESDMNPVEEASHLGHGGDDQVWLIRHTYAYTRFLAEEEELEDGDYVLTAHSGLGHIGLIRIGTNPFEEGEIRPVYRCASCGLLLELDEDGDWGAAPGTFEEDDHDHEHQPERQP